MSETIKSFIKTKIPIDARPYADNFNGYFVSYLYTKINKKMFAYLFHIDFSTSDIFPYIQMKQTVLPEE